MLEIGNIVKVKSNASYKNYGQFGRVIKQCSSNYEPLYEVYFSDTNCKARFYESSLDRVR